MDVGAAPVTISVVTATLNRRDLLENAIRSVLAQRFDGVEHIVVDALSSDGTSEMLATYPHLRVLRERDDGLYDAWNKGVALARGHLVCFLNSDDEIPAGAFDAAASALAANPGAEIVTGPAELFREAPDGREGRRIVDAPLILKLREQNIGPGIPVTNAHYLSVDLIRRVGPFRQSWRLVADRDFLLRALLAGPRQVVIQHPLYRYREHPGSLTLSGRDATTRLAEDSLAAAISGLTASRSRPERDAYARWHAWSAAYLAGLRLREGRPAAGLAELRRAFARDAAWPLRLPVSVARHLVERPSRRGRPLET